MTTANKANMDSMLECMNALVASAGGNKQYNDNKENALPASTNASATTTGTGGDTTKKPKCKKKMCPNCKTFVYHTPDKCYKLEANNDTRYPG